MAGAREQGLNIIGVKETDPRYGVPDFAEEKERARTAGPDIEKILDDLVAIPLRREAHEVACYHQQILKHLIPFFEILRHQVLDFLR